MDELKKHITQLREDFMLSELRVEELKKEPFEQFERWLSEAVKASIPEVQAMNLSTIGANNRPSSRIVYLREFENNSFWFYGNYESRKGKELAANHHATISFFWPQLERQIRIEGVVGKAAAERSDAYFNDRPRESQLGAWASAQSAVLASRKELEDKLEEYKKEFENKAIPRPAYWGGWELKANYYEFWQGRKSRLHDRFCYVPENKGWKITRLAP